MAAESARSLVTGFYRSAKLGRTEYCDTWTRPREVVVPSPPWAHHAPHRHLLAPAALGNISLAPRPRRTSQQAPCLPIDFKHPLAPRTVIKMNRRPRNKRIRRNHIPKIFLNHIRRQKIQIIQRVEWPAAGRPGVASRVAMAGGALHLHPPQPPPALHRKVIRTAISPRLQHRKPQHSSLRQKRSLHRLTQPFAREPIQPLGPKNLVFCLPIRFSRHKKSADWVS
jgi:hypothetical protein